MTPRATRLAFLLLLLWLPGCAGVQVGTGTRPFESGDPNTDPDHTWQLHANVWGYYVFAKLPGATGSIDHPGTWVWFTDTVNTEAITRLLGDAATALGATELRDVEVVVHSDWFAGPLWIAEAWGSAVATAPPDRHEVPPLLPPSQRGELAAQQDP
jgi:hypothetical protein